MPLFSNQAKAGESEVVDGDISRRTVNMR